jgi:hypothetical protein
MTKRHQMKKDGEGVFPAAILPDGMVQLRVSARFSKGADMLKLTSEAKAQLRAEQRAGRDAVRKAKAEADAKRRLERQRQRLPKARARAAKAEQAAIAAAVNRAIDHAARRTALLAEIAQLPETAFVSDRHAAAYLGTEVGVLRCWNDMRRGPPTYGSESYVRYRISDLVAWMAQRTGEIDGATDPNDPAPAPRLIWSSPQPEHTAEQQEETLIE